MPKLIMVVVATLCFIGLPSAVAQPPAVPWTPGPLPPLFMPAPPPPLPPPPPPPSAPCGPAARACLKLSTNQAWLMNNGVVTYGPVPVTHGRRGYLTPPGVFRVTMKNARHWSTIYHAPMPYSVFFNGGIAFHEGSLTVLSHGCIHLSHAAAVRFFNTLQRGDQVQVVS